MFFGGGDSDFTTEIENAFARFGMKNEETVKGKSKNALRLKMYDTIHDSAYTAIALKKSAGKNVEKVWADIIENDLIPQALESAGGGAANAGALIVPSKDIDAVTEILRKKGAAPTVYQLFEGYAVAGLNKQNMGLLVKGAEPEKSPEEKPEQKQEQQPQTPQNQPDSTEHVTMPDLVAELARISESESEPEPEKKKELPKSGMPLSRKLAAAALLGIAVGVVPFAAKSISESLTTPKPTAEQTVAAQQAERYFADAKNGAPEDIEVMKAIASNPDAAREYLEKLADTPVGIDVVKNPSAPEKIVENASKDNDEAMRAAAAENPNTPPHILKRLLNDKSPAVRAALARNPEITTEMMTRLAADENPEVRESLLENMSLPPDILDEVTKNAPRSCEMLRKMMANPCMSPESLDYNKDNPNECIRAGVAANPNTPPDAIAKLADDNTRTVRDAALKNPQIPEAAFGKAFRDWNPVNETREQVADRKAALENIAINPDVIKKAVTLSPDDYTTAAAANPRTPAETLARIMERATGKRGLKDFIDDAENIPEDKKLVESLKKKAAGTDIATPLRKLLNEKFAKEVFDPYTVAKAARDAFGKQPEIKEYKLTKPKMQRSAATGGGNQANRTYSIDDMPEIPANFTDMPLAGDGAESGESAAAEQAALETADAIIDSIMADILPAVESAAFSPSGKSVPPSANTRLDSASTAPSSTLGGIGGYGIGGATSTNGSMPREERAELLFKNACERIDDLHKIF